MTAGRFRVTFDTVTPESAERSDFAESGFLDSRGWRVAALIGQETPGVGMKLRHAVALIGLVEPCDGDSWRECDWRERFDGSGESENRILHAPRSATAASLARIERCLEVFRP